MDPAEIKRMQEKKAEPEGQSNVVREVSPDEEEENQTVQPKSTVVGLPDSQIVELDVAVNEALTWKSALKIFVNPLTWLPALAYMTSFGFELAVDSNLGNDIFRAHPSLGWIDAGYLASIFGLLNIFCRPIGGIIADTMYARFGVKSKKYLMLGFGMAQGCFAIGFGQLLKSSKSPDLGSMMGLVVMMALACNTVNGINFSLVPHCNSYNNGVMSGIVGAFGNVGGICYSLMWRFKPAQGVAWMYAGVFALIINFCLLAVPSPKH
jgi:NNP family nitrate/nitrite transporter-like MFS transporter